MGQAVSQPGDETAEILTSSSNVVVKKKKKKKIKTTKKKSSGKVYKTSLYDLNDTELTTLLLETKPLSLEEIKMVGSSLSKKNGSRSTTKNSDGSNSSSSPSLGFYSQEADSPEIQLAMRINEILSTASKQKKSSSSTTTPPPTNLNHMRFKLVPSRMKEPIFWESVFLILKERLVEQNAAEELKALEEQDADADENNENELGKEKVSRNQERTQQPTRMNGHGSSRQAVPKPSQSFPDDETDDMMMNHHNNNGDNTSVESQLALRNSQVTYLTRQVKQLRQQLQEYERNGTQKGNTKDKTPKKVHHGHWIIDKDSKEFLEYPPELKTNMRKEKQKRLDQVQKDMKFILDSDDVEDTNGYWDCCGSTHYSSGKCM